MKLIAPPPASLKTEPVTVNGYIGVRQPIR